MAPRLSGQTSIFVFVFFFFYIDSIVDIWYTGIFEKLHFQPEKPRGHVRIMIYSNVGYWKFNFHWNTGLHLTSLEYINLTFIVLMTLKTLLNNYFVLLKKCRFYFSPNAKWRIQFYLILFSIQPPGSGLTEREVNDRDLGPSQEISWWFSRRLDGHLGTKRKSTLCNQQGTVFGLQ